MLEIGMTYDTVNDILTKKDIDNTKYKFSFNQDISWRWASNEVKKQLDIYYNDNNTDKFIKLYNKYNSIDGSDGPFKIVKINNMVGPGGGAPDVKLSMNRFMTIKELINEVGQEYLEDYAWQLTVDAIENN